MAKRINVTEGEWIDVSQNLANSVQEYAMENNLRYGEAFVGYLDEELTGGSEEETDEE